MDSDDYGEIPATPGGGETPLRDEEGEEYNPEVQQVNEDDEYNPELLHDEGQEYNPEISRHMEVSDGELDGHADDGDVDPQYNAEVEQSMVAEIERLSSPLSHISNRSGQSSPAYSLKSPNSQPASPVGSGEPCSPARSGGPESPAESDDVRSPAGSGGPLSPAGSGGPLSPAGSGGPVSPALSGGPVSPALSGGPVSPAGSGGPVSPALSGGPVSPALSSGPVSPTGSGGPVSPALSGGPVSPALSGGPVSPTGSGGPVSPALSGGPVSPTLSGGPVSPTGSGGPLSPSGSDQRSPAGSDERGSPVGSGGQASPARSLGSFGHSRSPKIGPRSPLVEEGAHRSRSGSPRSPVRSVASSPRSSNAGSRHSSPASRRMKAIESESEEESIKKPKLGRKRRIKAIDDEDSDTETVKKVTHSDSEGEERVTKKRKRVRNNASDEEGSEKEEAAKILPSDSEDEEGGTPRSGKRKVRASDDEESEKGSNELIDDIFGKSDEEEEFEGFGEADVASSSKRDKKQQAGFGSDDEDDDEVSSKGKPESVLPELSSDEDGDGKKHRPDDFLSDFDLMLERKRAEAQRRRKKRKDVEILNDSDDFIEDMIKKMKEAVEADRELNKQRKPAIKVLCMLPFVKRNLLKVDLHTAMIDGGILPAITEWLAPLPDKSLPHLEVREALLKQLLEFSQISTEGLRMSGLGKAVMYLLKHPRETRANKEIANKLINDWARPIFSQNTDYKNLSREEREQRDYEQLPKKRRISMEGGATPHRDIGKAMAGDEKVLRPGDPGYVYRARVPQPSNRDYVIRPKWNVEEKPMKGSSRKGVTKLDKYVRQGRKSKQTFQSAVKISIEGRNMSL